MQAQWYEPFNFLPLSTPRRLRFGSALAPLVLRLAAFGRSQVSFGDFVAYPLGAPTKMMYITFSYFF